MHQVNSESSQKNFLQSSLGKTSEMSTVADEDSTKKELKVPTELPAGGLFMKRMSRLASNPANEKSQNNLNASWNSTGLTVSIK